MVKVTRYFGIDVSKDSLDIFSTDTGHQHFENNKAGFRRLCKLLDRESHVVMEATGVYHERLANYLHEKSYRLSVVNPLAVKRYGQMLLRATKTDKADAQLIMKYGVSQHPPLWQPPAEYIRRCKDLNGVLVLLLKQKTALSNKLHSLKSKGKVTGITGKSLRAMLKSLDKQIGNLEQEMESLVESSAGELYQRLKGIPGIGPKTAIFLIVITDEFRLFESSKQVSSYLGLSPSIRTSGTSIRGQSRITKSGNSHIRNLLFLSSFSACKYNPACKAMYERMVEKGKSKKLALIAVANKLLKQSFALYKSGRAFDQNFVSEMPPAK